MKARWILVASLVGLVGCGDDPIKKPVPPGNNGSTNNVSTNNGSTNNGSTNNGSTNNVSTNNGSTNNTASGPCAALDATALSFGSALVEDEVSRVVSIRNCSTTDALEVESVGIDGDGFDATLLDDGVAQPGESIEVSVTFFPMTTGEYTGSLTITHTASSQPAVVGLSGIGSNTSCVNSVARARNASNGGTFGSTVTVMPGQTVELDGSQSSSSVATVQYEWSIVSKPTLSTVMLSNNSAASPVFTPDVPGDYRVRLTATDTAGTESCGAANVTITATNDDGGGGVNIALQVVWSTPLDQTPSDDSGADLDLHWLRQGGQWNQAPYDCHWQNVEPDWGVTGDDSDNPSLDIDDAAGEGPENINHSNLEPGVVYSAGVHYYADNGFGASYATVRLYVDDQLAAESREQFLEFTNDFIHVFDYSTTGGVVRVESVTSGFP